MVIGSYSPFTKHHSLMIKFDLGGLSDSCGSPLYPAPTGGLCLFVRQHAGILTYFQTTVNKKRAQNCQNFGPLSFAWINDRFFESF